MTRRLLSSQTPRLVSLVGKIPPLRAWVSRRVITGYCSATLPRPRAFSMACDYTSWPGLTDRRFTGRHLPPTTAAMQEGLPSEQEVTALFRREQEVSSTDTSVLFAFFAQWFTDSFLRTSHEEGKFGQNTSNHEIDLCQIYGLSADKTAMLRSHVGGRLRSQRIDGDEFPEFLYQPRQPGGALVFKPEFAGLHDERFLTRIILGDAADERKDFVFAVGLEHGSSTIGNTVMNVVFVREHNRVAGVLQEANPDWDDERIFQTARNVLNVMLLNLVVQDIMHIAPLDFPLQNVPFMADGAVWNRSNWIAIEFNLLLPLALAGARRHRRRRRPDRAGGLSQQQPAGDLQGDRGPGHAAVRGQGGPNRADEHAPVPGRPSPSGPAFGRGRGPSASCGPPAWRRTTTTARLLIRSPRRASRS